ncbi:MAG: ABC-2 transporter permease [Clostridia bacterium]|nr:ABC-2 transporter permease [Clostridia bacterium]MBQ4158173.1 ABC-2 transporter permease [Clostridia bacterium]
MKGLLLKDLYMMKKYCRSYIFIAAVFIAIALFSNGNMFFVFYPCLLCGMIPVNLLGYDERSRWMQYSGTLPYTKTQIVSAKYLIGLFTQSAMLIVTGVSQGIKMIACGNFVFGEFAVLMLLLLVVATLTSSISLPFIFKLGVEKGRTVYFVMIGFVFAASALASGYFKGQFAAEINPNLLLAILAALGIGMYVFSWYMSIVFYKKREIS